jgi:hypothetical protein
VDSEPGVFANFVWQNTAIVVWSSQPTGPAVERMASVAETVVPHFHHGFSVIHVLESGVGVPTVEARAIFVKMMHQHAEQLACIVTVLLGTGFMVSALQSVITGMRMLTPRSFEFRLMSSLEAASAWLPAHHRARTGVSLDRKALHGALSSAYAQSVAQAEGVAVRAATESMGP